VALSELWLDTELKSDDLEHIARVMADSGLSLEELRRVPFVGAAFMRRIAPGANPQNH
jgi:hypothetical protein